MCSLKLNVLPFLPSRCSAVAQWSDARKHIKFYGSFHIFLVVIMVWWFLGTGNKDKRRWNTTELKPSDETIKTPLHSWTSSSQTLKKWTLFRQLRRFKKYFGSVIALSSLIKNVWVSDLCSVLSTAPSQQRGSSQPDWTLSGPTHRCCGRGHTGCLRDSSGCDLNNKQPGREKDIQKGLIYASQLQFDSSLGPKILFFCLADIPCDCKLKHPH